MLLATSRLSLCSPLPSRGLDWSTTLRQQLWNNSLLMRWWRSWAAHQWNLQTPGYHQLHAADLSTTIGQHALRVLWHAMSVARRCCTLHRSYCACHHQVTYMLPTFACDAEHVPDRCRHAEYKHTTVLPMKRQGFAFQIDARHCRHACPKPQAQHATPAPLLGQQKRREKQVVELHKNTNS